MIRGCITFFFALALPATASFSQAELSIYGSAQVVGNSVVSGSDPSGAGDFRFNSVWRARAADVPSHFGVRLTWWQRSGLGWGLDFENASIQATQDSLTGSGISNLGLSQGVNLFAVTAYRRWPETRRVHPYVGAGVGISMPQVEFDSAGGLTSSLQITGPAVQWLAGASLPLSDRWSVFGEYKGSYSVNTAELSNGGSFSTNLITNGVNVGLTLGF